MFPRDLPPAFTMLHVRPKTPPIASFSITAKLLDNCWTQFFGLKTALYHFEHRSSPKTDLSMTNGRSISKR